LLWSSFFLIFLIRPISDAIGEPHSAGFRTLTIGLTVALAAGYLFATVRGPSLPYAGRVLVIVGLTACAVGLTVAQGPESLVFLTYCVAPALLLLPRNVGAIFGMASAATMLAATRIVNGAADWGSAMVLVTLTVAMFAFTLLLHSIRQLRSAQHRIATLAVAEERSRLARDLHDVLGHSLTTITVKAGLARRMLESGDPGRAVAEVRDVEALARQAMTEVRATVSGYREASLGAELVGARAALSAAGITADLPNAVDDVAAGLQETFAYALREGVTNVIRHSRASQCQVRLGGTWLEVRDNGHVAPQDVASSRVDGGGHGLSGLAERVGAINGTLDAGPLPTGGFLLRVSVPDGDGVLVGRP
jgi:two-component system sensor histidine kinase DesK